MTANAANIFVAGSGTLWISDAGQTVALPTDATTTPVTNWSDMGHYTEKGVTLKPAWTSKDIKSTQSGGYPVRTIVTERSLTLEVELMEERGAKVLPVIFGGGTYTAGTSPAYTFVPPVAGTTDPRSIIFDAVDGAIKQRIVVPTAIAKSVGDMVFSREDAVIVKVTFTVQFPAAGGTPWFMYAA